MAEYTPTIGLEIHAELKTATKMFCVSRNDPNEPRPNVHICPVCMAHPGTLPVINAEAVRQVLRVGIALNSKMADYTEFDRKSYYYPDLPKGYQLSQYEHPLVSGGELAGVQITRVHLEEDTASSIHNDESGETTIDYNRAGVPLMELVTEPVITSAEQAGQLARELQILLRYLGVSDANMEKGEMRVEANVSVGSGGVRSPAYVEIKNINSFNTMERAVRYEIERQTRLLEEGGTIAKETRGWDEHKQVTFSQRSKEGSADYRYFPDPDLPSLRLSEVPELAPDMLRATLPELPAERRKRYLALGIKLDDAEFFVRDERFGDFFDTVAAELDGSSVLTASNYIGNDLVKIVRDIESRDAKTLDEMPIDERHFKNLVDLVAAKRVSSRVAKDLLLRSVHDGVDPAAVALSEGLHTSDDVGQLQKAVDAVIERHQAVVADYRGGKAAALEYLVGQCMKELRGAGDPKVLRQLLLETLS